MKAIQPPTTLPLRAAPPPKTPGRAGGVKNASDFHDVQATALEMSDDASALVAALRSQRTQRGDGGRAHADAWFERILADDAFEKTSSFGSALDEGQSHESLLSLALGLFPDPSDRLAMLMAQLGASAVGSARRRRLQALLDELQAGLPEEGETSFAAVRGGANVALTARAAGVRHRINPRMLRLSYRQFLASDMPESLLYEQWIEHFAFQRRADIVDFIDQALVADMLSLDPSGGRVEFGLLLEHISALRALRSFDKTALASPEQCAMCQAIGMTEQAWLCAMLGLLRTGFDQAGAFRDALSRAAFLLPARAYAAFLQSLLRSLRSVPHRLWPGTDDPQSMIEAIAAWQSQVGVREALEHGAGTRAWA